MKNKIKIIAAIITPFLFRIQVFAQDYTQDANAKDISGVVIAVARLLNLLLGLSGAVFIIMMFMMAIKFATSVDDPRGLDAAKQTGTTAVIGFLVVLGFFFLVNALVNAFGLNDGLLDPVGSINSATTNLMNWFGEAETQSNSVFKPTPVEAP
ncbi:hypothetical protein HN803_05850 [candidate division WWE3 bacterium]|jgi:hypothetical protein|nr:hypothetical protein [candidate division WWE3 bacterium]MBT7350278.1 hypothetical protein [candidate division WWE3 bacterium]